MTMQQLESVIASAKLETLRETLALLTKDGSDREVGRRTLLVAWLLDKSRVGSQKALAKRMGVSEGRVSQMLATLRRGIR